MKSLSLSSCPVNKLSKQALLAIEKILKWKSTVGSYIYVKKLSTAAGELRDALSGCGAWHQQHLLHVPTSST